MLAKEREEERFSLLALAPDELQGLFRAEGLESYRAAQVLRWLYQRGVRDFDAMTDLSRDVRARLADRFATRALEKEAELVAADGTRKLVLATRDGARVESVLIPEGARRTVCVSSQIGCSLDCCFCATGRLGLARNLRAAEIVDQVLWAAELAAREGERISHVVFMGMGEPLFNLREVLRAIRVLTAPEALALSPRRITVSTAGVVPKLAELGASARVRLAVSLHATTDAVRDQLVPLNRLFPLARLLEACKGYPLARRERISFEYTLMAGVNDSDDDAHRLAALLRGIPAKVNLIALNEHAGTVLRRPAEAVVDRFGETLASLHVTVSVRRSRGDDVLAACGQLGARAPAPHLAAPQDQAHPVFGR